METTTENTATKTTEATPKFEKDERVKNYKLKCLFAFSTKNAYAHGYQWHYVFQDKKGNYFYCITTTGWDIKYGVYLTWSFIVAEEKDEDNAIRIKNIH